jgi:hypothetical protein
MNQVGSLFEKLPPVREPYVASLIIIVTCLSLIILRATVRGIQRRHDAINKLHEKLNRAAGTFRASPAETYTLRSIVLSMMNYFSLRPNASWGQELHQTNLTSEELWRVYKYERAVLKQKLPEYDILFRKIIIFSAILLALRQGRKISSSELRALKKKIIADSLREMSNSSLSTVLREMKRVAR